MQATKGSAGERLREQRKRASRAAADEAAAPAALIPSRHAAGLEGGRDHEEPAERRGPPAAGAGRAGTVR
jgi:hypothetical protein